MRHLGALVVVTGLLVTLVPAPPAAGDYENLAESAACGYPRFFMPATGDSGSLSGSHLVRGPAGALFGRTVDDVQDRLVWWTVPMSHGARVQVHRRLLPALRMVEANLAEAASRGLHYPVRSTDTYGFVPRTSVAHDRISFHGVGAAIDINAADNPYRRDGALVTDMPAWFVEAWESAGFCWGGGWFGVKDAMHFSWMGPVATPGYGDLPPPLAPLTEATDFRRKVGSHEVVFGPGANQRLLGELNGDGAPDVAHIRPWSGDDFVLEVARSNGAYAACGISRWWIEDPPDAEGVLADIDGIGRPDLVFPHHTGDTVVVDRFTVLDGYQGRETITTGVEAGGEVVFGDANGDGADDLWSLTPLDEGSLSVEIWSAAGGFQELTESDRLPISMTTDVRLAVADRDMDGRDELMVVKPGHRSTVISVVDAAAPGTVAETVDGPVVAGSDIVAFEDYDGDGRPDLQVLTGEAVLEVWGGNTAQPGVSNTSWFLPSDFECPEDTLPYHHQGRFADDDGNEFQEDIEWLAGEGITRGCNPPFEDLFCPDEQVTRGQMAAFLSRGLGLEAAANPFTDVVGSVFEGDVGALAASGITRGCDPPANTRFCPDSPVTRGQMAAFLHRAADWFPQQ